MSSDQFPLNIYKILKFQNFQIFLSDWLTDLLMPSDKHNSRTARARDLVSLPINIASSQDVSFHQPQELQCLHHGATFVPLWSPILYNRICGRHIMASVWDIKIAEAFLILRIAYYIMKRVWHLTYRDTRCTFYKRIVHIAGWIAEMLFTMYAVLCL